MVTDKKLITIVELEGKEYTGEKSKIRASVDLHGFEKAALVLEIYKGHKKAKENGKKIKYDVDEKIEELESNIRDAKRTNDPSILAPEFIPADKHRTLDPGAYYWAAKNILGKRTDDFIKT